MRQTTAEENPQAAAKLHELIEDISIAMVVTVTVEGSLRSRPMLTQQMQEPGELWFLTSDEAGAAHDLADEHAVNVSYADPERQRYVSVSGQAAIIHDRSKQEKLWSPEYERFFPRGLEDPHLALLRVRIESAEYWDVSGGRMQPVHGHGGDGGERDQGNRSGTGSAPEAAGDSETEAIDDEKTGGGRGGGEGGDGHTKVDIRAVRASG